MAVKEDYDNLAIATKEWSKNLSKVKNYKQALNVSMCSPDDRQRLIVNNHFVTLPVISILREKDWNLDQPYPSDFPTPYVIVACNVFHYAYVPGQWLNNCLASCVELWIQDLCHRPRGGDLYHQFGKDQDMTRYWLGQSPTTYGHFNLQSFKDRLLDYWIYDAGSMRDGQTLINFIARFKGDL